jgi:hypothetical protein
MDMKKIKEDNLNMRIRMIEDRDYVEYKYEDDG